MKDKKYQCWKQKETGSWRKNQQILGPVIAWFQQEPILWHHPAYLPPFLVTNQAMVGTFGSLFVSQVLCLCRLVVGSSFKTAKNNKMNISNNRGSTHGGYCIVGPVENWKATSMFGGKHTSNPVLVTIDFILNAARGNICAFENVRNHYVEKVGFLVAYKDYIQTPQLDINSSSLKHSYIIHVPLCENGARIYLWERGDGKISIVI